MKKVGILSTGQQRKTWNWHKPNPYKLFSADAIVKIGNFIEIQKPRELVILRRLLADIAARCFAERHSYPRLDPTIISGEMVGHKCDWTIK